MTEKPENSQSAVPEKYSGLWIAWDRKRTQIIASGKSLSDARTAAIEAGESDPLLAKVPAKDVRFVGAGR